MALRPGKRGLRAVAERRLVTLSRGKLTPDESKALLRGIRELLPPEPATP